MPAFVLHAHPQIILGLKLKMRLERHAPILLDADLARQQAGTGHSRRGSGNGIVLLRQKTRPGTGAAQGHFKNFLGIAPGMGIAGIVAQHAVGGHHMVDVMRALLASLDLPRNKMGYADQGLGQDIQRKIETGKETSLAALSGRTALFAIPAPRMDFPQGVAFLAGLIAGLSLFGKGK